MRTHLPDHPDTVVARYPREEHASLADYADAVAAQISAPTFALVAHSVGGVVATSLLSRHPGRVTAILGIAAVVPRPGRSFVGSMPFPTRLVLGAVLKIAGTRPPAKAIRALTHGLPDTVADQILADFDPEPIRLYRDPTPARDLPAARAYLRGTADNEISQRCNEPPRQACRRPGPSTCPLATCRCCRSRPRSARASTSFSQRSTRTPLRPSRKPSKNVARDGRKGSTCGLDIIPCPHRSP